MKVNSFLEKELTKKSRPNIFNKFVEKMGVDFQWFKEIMFFKPQNYNLSELLDKHAKCVDVQYFAVINKKVVELSFNDTLINIINMKGIIPSSILEVSLYEDEEEMPEFELRIYKIDSKELENIFEKNSEMAKNIIKEMEDFF